MKKITITVLAFVFLVTGLIPVCFGQSLIWKIADLKKSTDLVKSMGGMMIRRDHTLYQRPPYYKGDMPLKYSELRLDMSTGGMMGASMGATLLHDFATWRTTYIYLDEMAIISGMPSGALTIDKSGKLVAESKVLRTIQNEKQLAGFEIMEAHYTGQRQKIYSGKFRTDFPMCFKIKEIDPVGSKEKEYYFMWAGLGF